MAQTKDTITIEAQHLGELSQELLLETGRHYGAVSVRGLINPASPFRQDSADGLHAGFVTLYRGCSANGA